jgi:hypothetical protein
MLSNCYGVIWMLHGNLMKWYRFYVRTLLDYSLERSLALNYSFDIYIVSRGRLPPSVYLINNTRVIRMAVVANDPADFSRNSYSQRTLNDLLDSNGHSNNRIDLLRLVGADRDVVQMWELVHYLINDNVLRHVQQLHLMVYIGKFTSWCEDFVVGALLICDDICYVNANWQERLDWNDLLMFR